jgi:iron complex transport system ATP-binding protein
MSTVLRLEAVEQRFGGLHALKDVSFEVEEGEILGVIGPNGAGKSTLLACLAGLRKPGSGQVVLDGTDVLAMAPRARARRIGFIPQTAEVAWAVEARILVGLGRTPFIGSSGLSTEDSTAIDRAMAAAGVTELADRDVTTLSGGERGRVLIARALAGDPEWLLADEPLAGLDPGHQLDAGDLFRAMAHEQGRGVVVTLHDLSLAARIADRIIVMAAGKVVADGPPAVALAPEVMAQAYDIEARFSQGAGGPMIEVVGRGR